MAKDGAQAVIVQGFFGPFASRIVQIANRHRIGYMSNDRSAVAAGGLVSVSANFPVLYEQAATYVDKSLRARFRPVCRLSSLPNFRLPSTTGQFRR